MPAARRVTPPASAPWRRLAVLLVFAAAVIQLLVMNLDPAAPIRQGLGTASPMAQQARRLNGLTAPVVRLADGRNVQLHFARAPHLPPAADAIADAVYYGSNYAMYPARAYVGDGRQVINGGESLRRADQVPPVDRLHDRGVAAVVTFPLDAGGLHRPTAVAVR